MDDFLARAEAMIAAWHGVQAPNEAGRRMAADLVDTIRAFEKLRGTMQFEEEPATFELALRQTKEPTP